MMLSHGCHYRSEGHDVPCWDSYNVSAVNKVSLESASMRGRFNACHQSVPLLVTQVSAQQTRYVCYQ